MLAQSLASNIYFRTLKVIRSIQPALRCRYRHHHPRQRETVRAANNTHTPRCSGNTFRPPASPSVLPLPRRRLDTTIAVSKPTAATPRPARLCLLPIGLQSLSHLRSCPDPSTLHRVLITQCLDFCQFVRGCTEALWDSCMSWFRCIEWSFVEWGTESLRSRASSICAANRAWRRTRARASATRACFFWR